MIPNWQQREMEEIWDSLEPNLESYLIQVDSILRKMTSEMMTFGVPSKHVEEYVRRKFWELSAEIVTAKEFKGVKSA